MLTGPLHVLRCLSYVLSIMLIQTRMRVHVHTNSNGTTRTAHVVWARVGYSIERIVVLVSGSSGLWWKRSLTEMALSTSSFKQGPTSLTLCSQSSQWVDTTSTFGAHRQSMAESCWLDPLIVPHASLSLVAVRDPRSSIQAPAVAAAKMSSDSGDDVDVRGEEEEEVSPKLLRFLLISCGFVIALWYPMAVFVGCSNRKNTT